MVDSAKVDSAVAGYALLVRESSNRVFSRSAPELLCAELSALGVHLSAGAGDVAIEQLGGLEFATFTAKSLTDRDIFILSNLALGRGLFERTDQGLLRPITVSPVAHFDSDLITIQRYSGKTNEQFTHLLVNLGLAASRAAHRRAEAGHRIRLLDPVSGRGTTTHRGLMYGFDVAGIEHDDASVDQHRIFLTTYLKDHRLKHKATTHRVRKGELAGTSGFAVVIHPSSVDADQHVTVRRADSAQAATLYSGSSFDVIVGDLPYGIHHVAKKGGARRVDIDRSPEQLVAASIAGWRKLLAHEGSLALSWNTKTLERATLVRIVEDAGLTVRDHPRSFEHVVDRQITRDLVVAVR